MAYLISVFSVYTKLETLSLNKKFHTVVKPLSNRLNASQSVRLSCPMFNSNSTAMNRRTDTEVVYQVFIGSSDTLSLISVKCHKYSFLDMKKAVNPKTNCLINIKTKFCYSFSSFFFLSHHVPANEQVPPIAIKAIIIIKNSIFLSPFNLINIGK